MTPVVDPECRVERYVIIEYGIWQPTKVGRSWLAYYSHIGHDAVVGDRCEIMAGTIVAAHCVIEDDVKLGLHTVMRPGIHIGEGARTGCGAVVVDDIPAGETWVGNPAHNIDDKLYFIHGPRHVRG